MKKLLFALPFLLFACKTRINPEKQAFYCKVNGEVFIPEKDSSPFGGVGSSPLKVSYDTQYNWMYISAWNKSEYVSLKIKLNPNEEISIKEYLLTDDIKNSTGTYSYNSTASASERDYLKSTSGKIV